MRGIQAKRLRDWARQERAGEQGVVEREVVQRGSRDSTLVQSPSGIRALYLQLKKQFRRLTQFAGITKSSPARVRKPSDSFKFRDGRGPAVIQKPLELILGNCPPTQKKDAMGNDYLVLHPTYVRARHAADRGDGATVKRIAASFA